MDIYSTSLVLMEILNGDELGYFSEQEIVTGEPQKMAQNHPSPLARTLAFGLEPIASQRPNALEYWRLIRKAAYEHMKEAVT